MRRKSNINMTKQTPEQEKRAIETIGKIVTAIANSIEKDKKLVIAEMVASMKVQADVISRARTKGIEVSDLMEEIKTAYSLGKEGR